jgi:hypothetical protein
MLARVVCPHRWNMTQLYRPEGDREGLKNWRCRSMSQARSIYQLTDACSDHLNLKNLYGPICDIFRHNAALSGSRTALGMAKTLRRPQSGRLFFDQFTPRQTARDTPDRSRRRLAEIVNAKTMVEGNRSENAEPAAKPCLIRHFGRSAAFGMCPAQGPRLKREGKTRIPAQRREQPDRARERTENRTAIGPAQQPSAPPRAANHIRPTARYSAFR